MEVSFFMGFGYFYYNNVVSVNTVYFILSFFVHN